MPGTLIVSEATTISRRAAGSKNVPGIWSAPQIAAWKRITDAVHERGCTIYCQLWHSGRAGNPDVLDGPLFSSSAVPLAEPEGSPVPKEMTEGDIAEVMQDFASAARNAIEAGFDGVEIHGANGYLPDQFLQDTCNRRTDRWGGSIENRARFHIELTRKVAEAIGADKTGMRLSPYSDWQGMLMDDPDPSFRYVIEQLKPMGLAYLHLIEARIRGNDDVDSGDQSVRWMVEEWNNAAPVLIAGGFTPETARRAVDDVYQRFDVVIVFGRFFVANPDLVFKVKTGVELVKYERTYFYTPGITKGYIDYPFSQEYLSAH